MLKILHVAWDIHILKTYLLIILNSNLADILFYLATLLSKD